MVNVAGIIVGHKSEHCCGAATGTHMDCEDVVINRAKEQCAFVEDINDCPHLPRGWEQYGWCPFATVGWNDGTWVGYIECLTEEEATATNYALYIIVASSCIGLLLLGLWILRKRKRSPRAGPEH
jgi:hypothetical protein